MYEEFEDAQDIKDYLGEVNENILLADNFDEALLGYVEICGSPAVALYDTAKCIEILVTEHEMTEEEAWEYFQFNVAGAYVGENTPAFATILKKKR